MHRLQQLREAATRPRKTVPVVLNGEVREQIEAVEDELDRLDEAPVKARRLAEKSAGSALREDLAKLRGEAEESTIYVVLEAMQRTPYRALLAAHPPRVDGDGNVVPLDRGGFNADTFSPALVKACLVGYRERPDADAPILTDWPSDDFVDWLVDDYCSAGQIDKLSTAAFALTRGDDAVPLPRQRSQTQTSGAE
jgi:hypothetical protein